MKGLFFSFIIFLISANAISAQSTLNLSSKVSVSWHPNIETYFIAERLAVQHMNYMVFTRKDSLYRHQPLVSKSYQQFKTYQNDASIIRIAELLSVIRDSLHDNAQILQYLVHLETFPGKGEKIPFRDSLIFRTQGQQSVFKTVKELSDSLRSFYTKAEVGNFLLKNRSDYEKALHEVAKDINEKTFSAMERYYGETFASYSIYLMPTMPIPFGPDNYRAFGPMMDWPKGRVSAMFISSSVPMPHGKKFKGVGFDNPSVTKFLTVHEMGHSFMNRHVEPYKDKIEKKGDLFTPTLQKVLEPSYIGSWYTCVIEHLVRLGEIRTAVAMGNMKEAERLRIMHTDQLHFILLPLLEHKILEYETNRSHYPDINSFLPELLSVFDSLNPIQIDNLLKNHSTGNIEKNTSK